MGLGEDCHMGNMDGRTVLVTGASRNIGRAIATTLATLGADIIVHVASDKSAGAETANAVESLGQRAVLVAGDLGLPDEAASVVEQAENAWGRLDCVVNNAAIRPESPLMDIAYDDWRRVMSVSLDSVFLVSQAAFPHLKKSDQAAIVNIGGLTGHTGAPHRAHVVTAKAGVVGLTKALAHEMAEHNITVNCVSPGLIETQRQASSVLSPKHHQKSKNLLGRRGTALDVAAAVAFLCGPGARYLTGQTLHSNGGAFLP